MILALIGGLLALVAGAEILVRGASRMGTRAGISRLVVGLTVVAFGTSAPEVAVSVGSALEGQAELALGNVVGSNIFNILFILGVSALLAPLVVSSQLVRWDVPLGIGVATATLLFALDGAVGRIDGLVLVAGLAAYTAFLVRHARSEAEPPAGERSEDPGSTVESESSERSESPPSNGPGAGAVSPLTPWILDGAWILGGLGLLVFGANWFLGGAVQLATRLGLSELVIGLTIVAGGTSLPELATSVLAGMRGERDIAVGNVVGSNLFNLLGVLGLSALVAPGGVPVSEAILWFDLPVMIAVAVACLPIFVSGYTIARWEGALFLAYYGAYTAYLVLAATDHAALSAFSGVMVAFVLPLTAITLVVVSVHLWRRPSSAS